MTELQIRKDDFTRTRLVETETPETLGEGEVLLEVDAFAVTANNVTYAVAGDRIGYWQFFPPAGDDTDGWGVVPMWGFAVVTGSRAEGIEIGERIYGYFPPATHLVVKPAHVSAQSFFDSAEHRARLPAGYNLYRRIAGEPGYDPTNTTFRADAERMLLCPLHVTSFCLWDALQDASWHGAEQVIVLSASSKTSIGLGYAVHDDDAAPKSIGITSAGNVEMVEGLDIYDRVASYDDLDAVDASKKTAIVDMAGNQAVLAKLHEKLGERMVKTLAVGITHWTDAAPQEGVIQERTEFFFAPSHIQRRMKEWGADGFANKSGAFLQRTALASRDWMRVEELRGLEVLEERFADVVHGKIPADTGLVVILPSDPESAE